MPKKPNLVIVESPSKAKTLKKFLGSGYKIEASVGHVRDLPKSELGIDVERDFEPKYITIRGKGEVLAKLRKESKNAGKVYLATDPDREGEAISWHLMHALKLDPSKASRITFNEITKNAVTRSLKEARGIDMDLVDAQQARRELDRIVGYTLSPLLWKKVRRRLSAGRVQSVAVRMICDREEEIENFVPEEYWSLDAVLTAGKDRLKVSYAAADNGKFELKTREDADRVLSDIKGEKFTVADIKTGVRVRKPSAPFTTSTMQQEASKVLGFPTAKTMALAQQLYEGVDTKDGAVGLVTYIRTDSARVSDEAYNEAKKYIETNLGAEFLSPERPVYKSRGKVQDAHEAIRPSYIGLTPDSLKDSLPRDLHRLYRLIWERFMASQMAPASYDTVSVRAAAGDGERKKVFRASGSILNFKGFLLIYDKGEDDEAEAGVSVPKLEVGQVLRPEEFLPEQHFTAPPPRYSESQLVRTMEELGIGRPSTYASTISTIVARRYVVKENKLFYPTELGQLINDIMKTYFDDIVDIEFTAKMEEDLDRVEDGEIGWKDVLRGFYGGFSEKLKAAEEAIGKIEVEDEVTDVICEKCGRNMVIKYGRFGKFLGCPGFPECRNIKPFLEEAGADCPLCGAKVMVKKTKKGRTYYGCEKNPECPFMSWNRPTGEACPECGAYMAAKGKKAVCSNPECGFRKEMEGEENE
ncbi:MAG: type I DNA topoisomerase [Firmicutes bacterium]|nr:type I DNA topoisomerase [Bacillota bacterium]